jgi:hypothetical protein
MGTEGIKQALQGAWKSIAPELRPSTLKGPDGTIRPFFLARFFRYTIDDTFELAITNFADPYGSTPLVSMLIKGHITWQGDHPIAEGAQKVHFVADTAYDVTPLAQGFADLLNQVASTGFDRWEVNQEQSILQKRFAPFGLAEGQVFEEYDLIYLYDTLLFWGARHVDGRGFDTEVHRPTNLQIPLARA